MNTILPLLVLLFAGAAAGFSLSGTWLDINDTFTPRDKFGLSCAAAASGGGIDLTLFSTMSQSLQ